MLYPVIPYGDGQQRQRGYNLTAYMTACPKRGKGVKRMSNGDVYSPAERHIAMNWSQRLKRVFNIDIEVSL